LGSSKGGYPCKIHLLTDGNGLPCAAVLTGGQRGDAPQAIPLLEKFKRLNIKNIGRRYPNRVIADRAYDSQKIRAFLRERGIAAVITERKLKEGAKRRRKGRKPQPKAEVYAQRNRIERGIGHIKEQRRIATRYEKLVNNFLGMIHMAMIRKYLRMLAA